MSNIIFTPTIPRYIKISICFPTRLLAQEATHSLSARNLSIVFDSALHFKCHISGISRACYYHTINFNVTENKISKLLGVQKCLSRVVTKSPRFCHITPLLKYLHWLPVRYKIKFKMCSLTYQALTSGQPVDIRNMLQLSRKVRTLRSSDLDQLNVPRVRTAVGSRAFFVTAPRLWNELSLEIRFAKTQLVYGRN